MDLSEERINAPKDSFKMKTKLLRIAGVFLVIAILVAIILTLKEVFGTKKKEIEEGIIISILHTLTYHKIILFQN